VTLLYPVPSFSFLSGIFVPVLLPHFAKSPCLRLKLPHKFHVLFLSSALIRTSFVDPLLILPTMANLCRVLDWEAFYATLEDVQFNRLPVAHLAFTGCRRLLPIPFATPRIGEIPKRPISLLSLPSAFRVSCLSTRPQHYPSSLS